VLALKEDAGPETSGGFTIPMPVLITIAPSTKTAEGWCFFKTDRKIYAATKPSVCMYECARAPGDVGELEVTRTTTTRNATQSSGKQYPIVQNPSPQVILNYVVRAKTCRYLKSSMQSRKNPCANQQTDPREQEP
jgi:hypothetical protein